MKRQGLLIPNVKKLYHLLPKKKVTQEELYAELVAFDNIPPYKCATSIFIRKSMRLRGFKEITSAAAVTEKVKVFDGRGSKTAKRQACKND